ncbi:MAG: phosphoglycerate dehydrogenase [Flavobacteriales bacterium]|nr:phosphoglycerate dehydrogenase [Flavobacteriales bacterium]
MIETKKRTFVFDFDSTLTQVEAFEELAEVSLKGDPKKKEKIAQIAKITDQGVDGDITFTESLEKRLKILNAHKDHLDVLVKRLSRKISPSISRNKDFFKKFADDIYIVSCGFKEFIDPIMAKYGIPSERIHANTFRYNKGGKIIGFDRENDLSKPDGKIDELKKMELPGEVHVIGDGFSDYQMRAAGIADKFYAFTENVERKNILDKADHIAPSLDEILYKEKLPMAISYPKNRIKVLLLEGIHEDAVEMLKGEGYQVELMAGSMTEDELCEAVKGRHILGIRSKTQITAKVVEAADRLLAIGAFCIGTNQIDLDACLNKGICVFNAPFSNTRSVVEMVIGEMIMLMRGTHQKSMAMHRGEWDKSAKGSFEIRGKKLGIVGYGNIGAQLSVLAEALGMQVMYYDVEEKLALGNAQKAKTLRELMSKSDVVTLHVDGRSENNGMIGKKELGWMKDGAVFLNLARGKVVDLDALKAVLVSGKLRGAAIDVFPVEPKSNDEPFECPFTGMDNVILTPHVGGSTIEAQKNIAAYVPEALVNYVNSGDSFGSVNLPNIRVPEVKGAHRLLHVHQNVPGIMARINNIFSRFNINVVGQYLKTNQQIGYVITDIDKEYNSDVVDELRRIDHTIKLRVLY